MIGKYNCGLTEKKGKIWGPGDIRKSQLDDFLKTLSKSQTEVIPKSSTSQIDSSGNHPQFITQSYYM